MEEFLPLCVKLPDINPVAAQDHLFHATVSGIGVQFEVSPDGKRL
jgi:hypothetical protein